MASSESLCHAPQLGRHVMLHFPSCSFRVVCAFDLIHCDLWTSLISSISCYKCYLVILDDCTHYSWTFLPHHKSDMFPTLLVFRLYVHTIWLHHLDFRSIQCDNGRGFDNSHTFFLSQCLALDVMSPYFPVERQGRAHDLHHQRCHVLLAVPDFSLSSPILG
jgi:hypothetical protein